MYEIDVNTNKYDIKLVIAKFGKKTKKSLKRSIMKVDLAGLNKRMRKAFAGNLSVKRELPWPI